MAMQKALVVLSGGLDSTVVLAQCVKEFGSKFVHAVSFFYGQRHSREIDAVSNICRHYDVEYDIFDASAFFSGSKSTLLNNEGDIPEGSYEAQGEAPSTEVPFRNGVFLSIATSIAMEKGIDFIYCGIHQDDNRSAYADTSPAFFDGMRLAVAAGTHNKVTLRAPFINETKADIVRKGIELNVPFALTWSCYNGGKKPCGKCATCIQRAEAFKKAGFDDPALSV